jgi:hypothetical protein
MFFICTKDKINDMQPKKWRVLLMLFYVILFYSCGHPPKEKVIKIDGQGRKLKTFDGYFTRHYDTLGRVTEFYGFADFDDWRGCVHDKIFYDEKGNEVRRVLYNFNPNDKLCKIVDSMDFMEYKYYYLPDNTFIKVETYLPVKIRNKVVDYKLHYTQFKE